MRIFKNKKSNGENKPMSTGTRILCLIGGIGVLISGIIRIVTHDEWTLAIIGVLIIGFTVSGFFKGHNS